MVSIFSAGLSPASAFLAWRISSSASSSSSFSISVGWNSSSQLTVQSSKFGASSFVPSQFYNLNTNPNSLPANIEILLLAPDSLKSLSSFHRSPYASLVTPNHTIILIESTNCVELAPILQKRFPNNPVCAVLLADTPLRLSPDNSVLFHRGTQTTVLFSPFPSNFPESIQSRYTQLVDSLQSDGVRASIAQDYVAAQWTHAIPFLAFQPLTVLFEASSSKSLIQNILSKPLYSGIIQELTTLASKHSNCQFSSQYLNLLTDKFLKSDSIHISHTDGQDPPFLNCPVLFYNYFHNKPIPIDLFLLQPILMADTYGIKTPYMESVFAFISQMANYNASDSVFLTRVKPDYSSELGSASASSPSSSSVVSSSSFSCAPTSNSSSTDSSNSVVSDSLNTPASRTSSASSTSSAPVDADVISAKLQQLELFEQSLAQREQMLNTRDQKLSQWAHNLRQKSQEQSNSQHQNYQPQQCPQPQQSAQFQQNNNQRYYNIRPPGSQARTQSMVSTQSSTMTMMSVSESPVPQNSEDIDMMTITSHKNIRCSSRNGPMSPNPSANTNRMSVPANFMNTSAFQNYVGNNNGNYNFNNRGRLMSLNESFSSGYPRQKRMSATEYTIDQGVCFLTPEIDTISMLSTDRYADRYASVGSIMLTKSSRSNSLSTTSSGNGNNNNNNNGINGRATPDTINKARSNIPSQNQQQQQYRGQYKGQQNFGPPQQGQAITGVLTQSNRDKNGPVYTQGQNMNNRNGKENFNGNSNGNVSGKSVANSCSNGTGNANGTDNIGNPIYEPVNINNNTSSNPNAAAANLMNGRYISRRTAIANPNFITNPYAPANPNSTSSINPNLATPRSRPQPKLAGSQMYTPKQLQKQQNLQNEIRNVGNPRQAIGTSRQMNLARA